MASISALIIFPVILIMVFAVPVLIGIYVYRDAKSREMDAVMWTLIAVFVPSLIGLIVYLVIRGKHSRMQCPACGAHIEPEYSRCPGCGKTLKNLCPACNAPVECTWKVCPACGETLPENMTPVVEPLKDRLPVWLLVAVIAVPILLIIIMFVSIAGRVSYELIEESGAITVPEAYVQEAPALSQGAHDEMGRRYFAHGEEISFSFTDS